MNSFRHLQIQYREFTISSHSLFLTPFYRDKKKIQCCLVCSVIQFAQSSMETGTPITQLTTYTPNNIYISLHFFLLLDYISLNMCNGILHSVSRVTSFFLHDYVINWLESRVHSFLFFFRLGVCPCLFNFILKYT